MWQLSTFDLSSLVYLYFLFLLFKLRIQIVYVSMIWKLKNAIAMRDFNMWYKKFILSYYVFISSFFPRMGLSYTLYTFVTIMCLILFLTHWLKFLSVLYTVDKNGNLAHFLYENICFSCYLK